MDADLRTVEQFYYREARLLDCRQFKQWFALCAEEIEYTLPNRNAPVPERKRVGDESYHSIERELSGADAHESPLRVENYFSLALRADRLLKQDSWAENPPARTRRFITNIELLDVETHTEGHRQLHTASNFLLYYNRHQQEECLYSGQRRDLLLVKEPATDQDAATQRQISILRREVILDWNVIAAPSVGLLF